jgi:hypothetical protein
MNHLYRDCVEMESPRAAVFLGFEEAGLLKRAEVFHYRYAADIELGGERADSDAGAVFDDIEHAAAACVGQRVKNGIHIAVVKHVT